MIRGRFKTRAVMDAAVQQPRRVRRRVGRAVYFLLLSSFVLYLGDMLVGSFLFLRAPGLLMTDRFVIAASYTARVINIQVRPGDIVARGDVIGRLDSSEMLSAISGLVAQQASLIARQDELTARQRTIAAMMPVARDRLAAAESNAAAVASAGAKGYASKTFQGEMIRELFEARREKVSMEAEASSIKDQIDGVRQSLAEVDHALEQSRQAYSDGAIISSVDGVIGARVPNPGAVYRAGDPLLDILNGAPYVLAYLPTERFFGVSRGERVVVTDGTKSVAGVIERIETVADYLPPEFQSTFQPNEKQQIARVVLDSANIFPMLSKVYVTSSWSPAHVAAFLKEGIVRLGGLTQQESGQDSDSQKQSSLWQRRL
jgi:multidrug resistance efflux pump